MDTVYMLMKYATVSQGTLGVFEPLSCSPIVPLSCPLWAYSLQGGFSRMTCKPFFQLFLHQKLKTAFISTYVTNSSQNGSLKTTQNHKIPQQLVMKAHSQSRPAKRLCLEGVKPLKFAIVKHF